jgi:hypothetical protein
MASQLSNRVPFVASLDEKLPMWSSLMAQQEPHYQDRRKQAIWLEDQQIIISRQQLLIELWPVTYIHRLIADAITYAI